MKKKRADDAYKQLDFGMVKKTNKTKQTNQKQKQNKKQNKTKQKKKKKNCL